MIIRYAMSCCLAAAAVLLGLNGPLATVLLAWAGGLGLLCIGGAVLVARQPIGIATMGGRIGSCFVRWGFRAGRGRLTPAVLISWLVWTVVGFGLIVATRVWADPKTVVMVLTWTVDTLALFYVLGIVLSNWTTGAKVAGSLLVIAAALTAMIAFSAVIWVSAPADAAQTTALMLAGGPLLLLGVGYGLLLSTMVAGGKRANWH